MPQLPYNFTQQVLRRAVVLARPRATGKQPVSFNTIQRPKAGRPLGNGFNIDQLIKKTYVVDLHNSKWVRVSKGPTPTPKRSWVLKCETVTLEKGPQGKRIERKHVQAVYLADPGKGGKCSDGVSKIKMTCDCERWMYYWEVSCYKNGCADIIYSNGELPTTTNPMWRVSPCKHLLRVLLRIKRDGL